MKTNFQTNLSEERLEQISNTILAVDGIITHIMESPSGFVVIKTHRPGVKNRPNGYTILDQNNVPPSGISRDGKLTMATRTANKPNGFGEYKIKQPRISRLYPGNLIQAATEYKAIFNIDVINVTNDCEYKSNTIGKL